MRPRFQRSFVAMSLIAIAVASSFARPAQGAPKSGFSDFRGSYIGAVKSGTGSTIPPAAGDPQVLGRAFFGTTLPAGKGVGRGLLVISPAGTTIGTGVPVMFKVRKAVLRQGGRKATYTGRQTFQFSLINPTTANSTSGFRATLKKSARRVSLKTVVRATAFDIVSGNGFTLAAKVIAKS